MKIALFGYGKMGKEIEQIALKRGHEIVLKIRENEKYDISKADIGIDFSVPNAALHNIISCFKNNIPVVSGTTGWLDDFDKALTVCKENKGSFIYASNFSIGVNLFFELNKSLAKMMNPHKDYSLNVEEIHHTKKLDTPSGTAISIAEQIIKNSSKSDWELIENSVNQDSNSVPISAKRILDTPGTHKVSYTSEIDSIEIKHIANNRKGFALGAIIAAEWLIKKNGIYTMKDVLNIG
ncbi:4-hydroxy-tetrahydrodipicolinate reductase [Flavobacteriaceae bacterium]|jgi:4-hydroxy-tetrahydrodipicolinate reductase|nr:4-hydroxy-tetrahydrodipicolinate reductase [Flavobacteriaceae bacterium]MDC3285020.1 4-hydroxy-tetrahydrodipicolinate reductase [Flavobacteriaceae bacterium]